MSDESFARFIDDYYAESEEHLTSARAALLELEASGDEPSDQRRVVDDLFRFFHSLKGISAMVELRPAERLAHELESYLRAVRAGELAVTPDGITLLLEGTQMIEQIISAHRSKQASPAIDAIVKRIGRAIPAESKSPRVVPARSTTVPATRPARWKCVFAPTRELFARGIGVDVIRRRLADIGTVVEASPVVMPDATIAFNFIVEAAGGDDLRAVLQDDPVVVERLDPSVSPVETTASTAPAEVDSDSAVAGSLAPSHVVRVDLSRLDELMRQVGDLVISRARLLDSLSKVERFVPSTDWRNVQDNATVIDRQLRTLRESLMRVRLVPIGEIFRRMPFAVRDLARESSKKVTLLLHGQTTEIDKYLIERMMDPVLHLVRNAVSHGIEDPEERVAVGKQPEGTITLSASAAGELVTIEIADDGRGIDPAVVAERARQMGLQLPPGPLDAAAVLRLLCSPGFSTREDADRASGRGVGMAVVKETVERLSGTIGMESSPGIGTRFTIQLPLTLAIADALIGRVGDDYFAVPQAAVREVIDVAAGDVLRVEGNEIIPYREASLPIVRLARLFGIGVEPAARFHVFVIGSGTGAIGLAVDRIVGQREIVVRAISDPLVRVEGISGATDLGDGKVVLILDPAALAGIVKQRTGRVIGDAAAWGRIRA